MKITKKLLSKFEKEFNQNPINHAVSHSIARVGVNEASINQEALRRHNYIFSHTTKKGEITNQKRSGRCWMFAGYNVDRVKVMEKLKIENFEFSQTYLFFWDKMEKANHFLELMIEYAKKPLDSREVNSILSYDAVTDGNYWECFMALSQKYGAVPKDVMPETFHSTNSDDFVKVMDLRLKRAARDIRKNAQKGENLSTLQAIKEKALSEVYNICVKALGEPPKTFTWEYMDKDKKFQKIESTPIEFYKKYVGDYRKDMVNIIDEPRGKYKVGSLLQLKYFKSVTEDAGVQMLVVPIEELKQATIKSIQAGVPVWFACDVIKDYDRKSGIMDTELFKFDQTLTPMGEFNKGERMEFYSASACHAMVFTGVDLDDKNQPIKWQVENSWGDENGKKGIFSMSDEWFTEHNYQVIVDKKFVNKKYLKGLNKKKPIIIEPWDPVCKIGFITG